MVITDLKNKADYIALQYFVFLQKDLATFILRNHSFAGFLHFGITDQADFYITLIKAHGEYFEQEISFVLPLQP